MLLSDLGRVGFDPFLEVRRMQQEVNQRLAGVTASAAQEFPPVNLWVGNDSVALTAELPGTAPDEVELTVRDNTMTLKGECELSGGREIRLASSRAPLRKLLPDRQLDSL